MNPSPSPPPPQAQPLPPQAQLLPAPPPKPAKAPPSAPMCDEGPKPPPPKRDPPTEEAQPAPPAKHLSKEPVPRFKDPPPCVRRHPAETAVADRTVKAPPKDPPKTPIDAKCPVKAPPQDPGLPPRLHRAPQSPLDGAPQTPDAKAPLVPPMPQPSRAAQPCSPESTASDSSETLALPGLPQTPQPHGGAPLFAPETAVAEPEPLASEAHDWSKYEHYHLVEEDEEDIRTTSTGGTTTMGGTTSTGSTGGTTTTAVAEAREPRYKAQPQTRHASPVTPGGAPLFAPEAAVADVDEARRAPTSTHLPSQAPTEEEDEEEETMQEEEKRPKSGRSLHCCPTELDTDDEMPDLLAASPQINPFVPETREEKKKRFDKATRDPTYLNRMGAKVDVDRALHEEVVSAHSSSAAQSSQASPYQPSPEPVTSEVALPHHVTGLVPFRTWEQSVAYEGMDEETAVADVAMDEVPENVFYMMD